MKRNLRGFTLIELLIVVAIIGIIVSIAVLNLLSAVERAKQKKTMGDMRTFGTALESYNTDFNRYPAAAASIPGTPSTPVTSTTARAGLEPTYARKLPLNDGWGSFLLYSTYNGNSEYVILSGARNGVAEGLIGGGGATTNFNNDIIFTNGQFVQYPEGAQN